MQFIYYIETSEGKGDVRMRPVSRMKIARVEKGLTQQELAGQISVTRQTIGLIEQGRFNPSLALCIQIAKALGKTLDDLFWEEEIS